MGEVIRVVRNGRFIGWYLRFYDEKGTRRQRASKQPTQAEARKLLLQIEARIARGETAFAKPPPKAQPVRELIERFLIEYSRPNIKNIARYRVFARAALRRAVPHIGSRSADAITGTDIAKVRDTLAASHSPASVRTTLSHLGSLFSWAQREGLVEQNPCRGVERPTAEPTIDYLTRDEVAALLSHAREHAPDLHPLIATAVYTGLRKGELFGLRWRDVDVAARRLTVARSYDGTPKSGKPRHLRLPTLLTPILADWAQRCPKTSEGLVFPGRLRNGTWGLLRDTASLRGLPRLLQAAGCRVHAHPWHALRHTFASHFIMQGGNILTLQKILGHSDVKVTLVYAHLAPDFLADEMDRIRY